MNIIIVGGPGAGKGSLAKLIAKDFKLVHVSSGDIFREMALQKTELGDYIGDRINQGMLLPDDLVDWIMMKHINKAHPKNGFILDGFPRTRTQSESLVQSMHIDMVISVKATAETVVTRLCGRYMCEKCGVIHNKIWHDISKCRECGSPLYQREDDKEEAILKRIADYNKQFAPILKFFHGLKKCQMLEIQSDLSDNPENIYKKFLEQYGKAH
ncbi:MAG: nucleoside monophosphate kinase [Christensenellaceae bacterium]|jgi:adenylate kinase|nr:nucleoside monophosphate kinase [Christensenellaceae bacterium]